MYRVLALTGFDRSGTTFLGRYLQHTLPSTFFIGELDKGLTGLLGRRTIKCSCNSLLPECNVWSRVMLRLQSPQPSGVDIKTVYDAIFEMMSPDLIVDSSKDLNHILALQNLFSGNHLLLHVVRNPKGVAYSRMKTRIERVRRGKHPNARVAQRTNMMMIYDAVAWSLTNIYIELFMRRRSTLYFRLIYEHTSRDLPEFIHRFIDHPVVTGSGGGQVEHVIFGNNNRFTSAESVKIDESWKTSLSSYQKVIIDLITFPVRLMFNYRF